MSRQRPTAPSETKYTSSSEPLGQGDIFVLPHARQAPVLAVVINADCDLAHRKTDGVCSLLPIYTLREYLLEFWLHRFLAEEKKRLLDDITKALDPSLNHRDAVERWLASDDQIDLITWVREELDLGAKAKARLSSKLEQYLAVFGNEKNAEAQFRALCSTEKDPAAYALKRMRTAFDNIGEGHLFINEIYGRRKLGYVVRMRRIYSIPEDRCFTSERALRTSGIEADDNAFRIAALETPMRVKLLQMFAHQFSRVGLPDEFVEVRRLVFEDLANEMTNGANL